MIANSVIWILPALLAAGIAGVAIALFAELAILFAVLRKRVSPLRIISAFLVSNAASTMCGSFLKPIRIQYSEYSPRAENMQSYFISMVIALAVTLVVELLIWALFVQREARFPSRAVAAANIVGYALIAILVVWGQGIGAFAT